MRYGSFRRIDRSFRRFGRNCRLCGSCLRYGCARIVACIALYIGGTLRYRCVGSRRLNARVGGDPFSSRRICDRERGDSRPCVSIGRFGGIYRRERDHNGLCRLRAFGRVFSREKLLLRRLGLCFLGLCFFGLCFFGFCFFGLGLLGFCFLRLCFLRLVLGKLLLRQNYLLAVYIRFVFGKINVTAAYLVRKLVCREEKLVSV